MTTDESRAFAAELLQRDIANAAAAPQAQAPAPVEAVPAMLAAPQPQPVAPSPPPAPVPEEAPAGAQVQVGAPVEQAPPAPPPPLTSAASLAPDPLMSSAGYNRNLGVATKKLHEANAVTQDVESAEHRAQRDAAEAQQALDVRHAQEAEQNLIKQQELAKQNEAELNAEVADHKKIYASNPAAWWANHDTQGRIGAVLSMIGAGLGGRDPNKVMFDLIDRDVAEAQRQDENLSKLGVLQQRKYQSGVNATRDRQAAMEARRLASLAVVQDELQARTLSTADEKTKARLMAADAALDLAKNDKLSGELHNRFGERVQAAQIAQGEAKLGLEARGQDITLQSALAKAHQSTQDKMTGVPDFNGDGIPRSTAGKQMDQVLASKDALYGLSEMQKIVARIEKNGLSRLNAAELTQAKQEMEGVLRKYVGTGANLSPEEKANVDALSADIKGLAIEKLTGFSLANRVRTTQRYIAHHYSNSVNALGSGNNVPKEGTEVYNVLHDEEVEQHKTAGQQASDKAEVDRVLHSDMSDAAKALSLAAMAHQDNGVAKAMLAAHEEEQRNSVAAMGGAAGAQ